MRVAIIQSNYVPWKGYFDIIRRCDLFVIYDSVQFTRRDWRNRNRIKTPSGPGWLTVPVESRGKYTQAIEEVRISDPRWAEQHLKTLAANYRRARHFDSHWPFVEALYGGVEAEPCLSRVNEAMLRGLCAQLGIATRISRCTEFLGADAETPDSSGRLLEICRAAGASSYLSGPSAQGYLDVARFEDAGIAVEWMDYAGYPDYPQLWGPFEHQVSILDAILNLGPEADKCLAREVV